MAHTSYREADAEWEGIRAAQAHAEEKRQSSLTWQEKVMEAHQKEERRLVVELQKLRAIADRIPTVEFELHHHREKMTKFKEMNRL